MTAMAIDTGGRLPHMPTLPETTRDVLTTLANELRAVLDRLGVTGAIEAQRSRFARAIVARALAADPADGPPLVVRARVVVAGDTVGKARSDREPRLVVEVPPGTLVAAAASAHGNGAHAARHAIRNVRSGRVTKARGGESASPWPARMRDRRAARSLRRTDGRPAGGRSASRPA